jgi:hypothetical protein
MFGSAIMAVGALSSLMPLMNVATCSNMVALSQSATKAVVMSECLTTSDLINCVVRRRQLTVGIGLDRGLDLLVVHSCGRDAGGAGCIR